MNNSSMGPRKTRPFANATTNEAPVRLDAPGPDIDDVGEANERESPTETADYVARLVDESENRE